LIERFPVFGRRPVMHGGLLRGGTWVDDPEFDLDRHLVVQPAPGRGDRRGLEDFVGEQRSVPFDPAHPLWRVHLLQGYQGGSAVLLRYHHAMADGIRLTQVMMGLLDPVDGEPIALSARVGRSAPLISLRGAAGPALALLRTVGSVVKIALWTNPPSALDGQPGIAKTAAWSDPVPLDRLHDVAVRTGTTINDVCVTLVAGAMARYLAESPSDHKLAPGDDDVAWMVPANLEPPGQEPPRELGNHFALVLAVLPHGPASFADRLREVHSRMARIRGSWEPELTFALSRGLAVSPALLGGTAVRILGEKAVGVLTNVPGPRKPVALAGARVAGAVGFAPTSNRQAITACIFSYAGEVTFGFGTDRAVIPDAGALVAALHAEVLAALGPSDPGARVSVPVPRAEPGSAVATSAVAE
jgi:WS/DGAT/MGAT family acyltransferase